MVIALTSIHSSFYPPYINISNEDGMVKVIVRGSPVDDQCGPTTTAYFHPAEWMEFMGRLNTNTP